MKWTSLFFFVRNVSPDPYFDRPSLIAYLYKGICEERQHTAGEHCPEHQSLCPTENFVLEVIQGGPLGIKLTFITIGQG